MAKSMTNSKLPYKYIVIAVVAALMYEMQGCIVCVRDIPGKFDFISYPRVGSVIMYRGSCPWNAKCWQYAGKGAVLQPVVCHNYAIRGDIQTYKVIRQLVVGYSRGQRGIRSASCPKGYFILDRNNMYSYEGLPETEWRRLLRVKYGVDNTKTINRA